ncbi:MAG: hypothetical protein ACTHML_12040 [Ginsengibacter sp.]
MNDVEALKNEVKKYIDRADEKVLKMVHAMLEVDAGENDWWDEIPDSIKKEINEAVEDLDNGKGISHEDVKKMHPQWFLK